MTPCTVGVAIYEGDARTWHELDVDVDAPPGDPLLQRLAVMAGEEAVSDSDDLVASVFFISQN